MTALPGYYSTREAADALGITQAAVKDAVRRNALAAIVVAQRRLIPEGELERYRAERLGRPGPKKERTR